MTFEPRAGSLTFIALLAASLAQADDVTFKKVTLSSLREESPIVLTFTDSAIRIRELARNTATEIPYASITKITYERSAQHRLKSGATVALLAPGVGAAMIVSKSKSHWLVIEDQFAANPRTTVVRMDKSEWAGVLVAVREKAGKEVIFLPDDPDPILDPSAGSKDVREILPFGIAAVELALPSALASVECKITGRQADRIECTRDAERSKRTGPGGERVIVNLTAQGGNTSLQIKTVKTTLQGHNWSTPIYAQLRKVLEASTTVEAH